METLPRTLSRNRTWQDPGDKMRVAVYGGSFDPITNAHLTCVSETVHSGKVDEVWIVPCGPRPDKPSLRTSALERLVMCHLAVDATAFGTTFPVRVNDVEIMRPAADPDDDLRTAFRDEHPDVEFFFCLGSDLFKSLPHWDKGEQLVKEFQFLVIPRPGYELLGQVGLDDLDETPPVAAAGSRAWPCARGAPAVARPARGAAGPTGGEARRRRGAGRGREPEGRRRSTRTSGGSRCSRAPSPRCTSSRARDPRRAHLSWGEQERLNLEGGSMHPPRASCRRPCSRTSSATACTTPRCSPTDREQRPPTRASTSGRPPPSTPRAALGTVTGRAPPPPPPPGVVGGDRRAPTPAPTSR